MEVVSCLSGALCGGLGLGMVLVGVLMGATTRIVGATVVTLGLITLPALLRRGYDAGLASGVICASGTLGQIIPPSLILILLADIMNLSVGTLFAAAVMPGLLLAAIYCGYILLLGLIRPEAVPAVPAAERALISTRQLLAKLVKVIAPRSAWSSPCSAPSSPASPPRPRPRPRAPSVPWWSVPWAAVCPRL